jgi:hypothetical protein
LVWLIQLPCPDRSAATATVAPADKLTTDKLTTDKLTTDKLTTDKLTTDKLTAENPTPCRLKHGSVFACNSISAIGAEML